MIETVSYDGSKRGALAAWSWLRHFRTVWPGSFLCRCTIPQHAVINRLWGVMGEVTGAQLIAEALKAQVRAVKSSNSDVT